MMRIIALFLAAFLFAKPALAFDACVADAASSYQPVEGYYTRGLLFKIEKCGTQPSHLFGTFHSDDPKYNDVILRMAKAVGKPGAGYFEIPIDAETGAYAARAMALPEGQSLRTLAGEPLFTEASNILTAKGISAEITDHLAPWAVAVMLQLPPTLADGKVIDEKLQSFFTQVHKPVVGLETLEEHFSVFTAIPLEKQLILLREAVADLPETEAANQALDDAYASGDLRAIDRLGDEAFAAIGDAPLRAYLEAKLLRERNLAMAEKLAKVLPQGNLLIAVGALHLPDEYGLIRLLEKQGYYLTPVEP